MPAFRGGVSPAFLLFAACSFWGIATVLNKALLATISPALLLLVQLSASTVVLWPVCLLLRRVLPRGRDLWAAVALGIINPGVSYTFALLGLNQVSASVSSLLWATEPFLILILARMILKEPITGRVTGIILLGFFGVILVSGLFAGSGAARPVGLLFMFVAVLLCGIYTVYSRKIGGSVDALALVTVQQTAALVWAALLAAYVTEGSVVSALAKAPAIELLGAVLSGLLYYAVAYWLYLSALGRVTAAMAGASFNIIPLVTIAVAFVFLGERLTPIQVLGATLILASATALYWVTRRGQNTGGPVP